MCLLALTLLVARIAADNIDTPFSTKEFAVVTACFDRCFDFHGVKLGEQVSETRVAW